MARLNDDCGYYSDSYDQARERFRALTNQIISLRPGARTRSFLVPSRIDSDLSVDYLFVPPRGKKKTLICMISGVHGVECFTGSAIQLMFIEEFLLQRLAPADFDGGDNDVSFLLAHAMNPFGYKHLRRATENNVNLNRNFAVTPTMFETENPGYRKLAVQLAPTYRAVDPRVAFATNTANIFLRKLRGHLTSAEIIQGIGQGQFEYPHGLEYGGTKYEPQIADLLAVLKEHFDDYQEILFLDLHTGLGDRYQLHLIPGSIEREIDRIYLQHLFRAEKDSDLYVLTPTTAKGFYQTIGDSNELVMRWLKPGQRGIALTLEYGTLGNSTFAKLETLSRLIVENQGFHNGYRTLGARKRAQRQFIDLFAPNERKWQMNTIERARNLFSLIFARIPEPTIKL